jgi:hypothetical protein
MCTTPIFDRVEEKTGIVPFGRLVDEVMNTEPYKSARRVFWVVDNGPSHCGRASVQKMADAYPTARLIHLPVHASWLNPIELYFSIVQRKALTSNDFPNRRRGPHSGVPSRPTPDERSEHLRLDVPAASAELDRLDQSTSTTPTPRGS